MSVTHWSETPGQTTLTRRSLAAGDVQARQSLRVSPSGNQMNSGDHLREAGSEPRRVVVVVELQVTGNDAGNELCSYRSSRGEELAVVVILEA